jgi:hypothetical protein
VSAPYSSSRAYQFFQNVIVRAIAVGLYGRGIPPEQLAQLKHLRIARFKAPGLMDVVIERINSADQPFARISIASYYEQNGDLMRDPDVEVALSPSGNLYCMRYRNDGLGIDSEVEEVPGLTNTQAILRSAVHQNTLEFLLDTWFPQIRESYTLASVEWQEN